jgi:hypothetical protein
MRCRLREVKIEEVCLVICGPAWGLRHRYHVKTVVVDKTCKSCIIVP